MIALRVGLLLALSLTVTQSADEVIPCPGGECVKLHLCRDGEIVTDGSNLIDIRFNEDDPCEHYLLKCCAIPDEELTEPIPSGSSTGQTGGPTTGHLQNGGGNEDDSIVEPPPSDRDGSTGSGGQGGGSNQHGGAGNNQHGGSGDNQHGGSTGGSGGSIGTGDQGGSTGTGGPGGFPGTGGSGGDVVPHGPDDGTGGGGGHGVTQSPIHPPRENVGCGVRNADGVGFRITGNSDGESEYGEFPWMVAILKEEKALDQVINVYQCGGSLIHPKVILTAAHCVQNKQPHEIKVRLGEWDTQTTNEIYDHQDRNVTEIIVHDQFYKGGLFNDVALLVLDHPAELLDTVNTVCLPPQDKNFDLKRCFASGWGKDVFGKEGKYQVILKKIELPVMPFNDCQNALRTTRLGKRFILNKSFICAGGEPGKDTCKGDGGSPLVCPIENTNRYYQAGIVAWGIGCGETGIPGIYVNVAGFRSWIDQHLTKRGINHDYYIYV